MEVISLDRLHNVIFKGHRAKRSSGLDHRRRWLTGLGSSPVLLHMHVVVFSKSVFHAGTPLYPPDILFSTYSLYSVCWPPVGPQDIKHKK